MTKPFKLPENYNVSEKELDKMLDDRSYLVPYIKNYNLDKGKIVESLLLINEATFRKSHKDRLETIKLIRKIPYVLKKYKIANDYTRRYALPLLKDEAISAYKINNEDVIKDLEDSIVLLEKNITSILKLYDNTPTKALLKEYEKPLLSIKKYESSERMRRVLLFLAKHFYDRGIHTKYKLSKFCLYFILPILPLEYNIDHEYMKTLFRKYKIFEFAKSCYEALQDAGGVAEVYEEDFLVEIYYKYNLYI